MGNRPKNPELREGHANEGTTLDRAKPSGRTVKAKAPRCPATITSKAGRKMWREIWALGASVYIEGRDRIVITRYVELQERRTELVEAIGEWTSVGSNGQIVLHPLARMLTTLEQQLVPLEDRLGLSPEAGLRLGITAVEHQSKLQAFIKGDT